MGTNAMPQESTSALHTESEIDFKNQSESVSNWNTH